MTPYEIFIGANRPYSLNKHDCAWMITAGEVEIFYADLDENQNLRSARNYLYTASKGDLVFGLKTQARKEGLSLIAVSSEARLIEVPKKELYQIDPTQLADQLERWITQVSTSFEDGNIPRVYQSLEEGEAYSLKKNQVAYPAKGLSWVKLVSGKLAIYGKTDVEHLHDCPVPVSNHLWVTAQSDETEIEVASTSEVIQEELACEGALEHLQVYFFGQIENQFRASLSESNRGIEAKALADERTIQDSLTRLGAIVYSKNGVGGFSEVNSENPLLATCQLIGNEVGFKFTAPKHQDENSQNTTNQLFSIAQMSQTRVRKVILRVGWWKDENGHLLAFTKEGKKPVALIQDTAGSYLIKNVETQTSEPITAEIAETLDPISYMFFYAFDQQMTSIGKIFNFALKGLHKDGIYIILAALCGSLIGLLVPILSGILFDDVIPQADRSFLVEIVVIMLIIGVVTSLLGLIQGILQMRLETKSNINVQAGLMDHLLRLPVTFYRKYAAGDLTMRALGINSLRAIISNTVLTAVLSGTFSLVNLFLLFYYDAGLAWVGIGLAFGAVAVVAGIGLLKLRFDRQIADVQGDIQGVLFEFLSGITKIRVTGSEKRIFSLWASRFAKLKTLGFRSGNHQNYVEMFNGSYPLLTKIFFFGCLYYWLTTATTAVERSMISVGAFMAFLSAFNQFLRDCLNLSMAMISSLHMIPLYERVKPILEAIPESSVESADPGELMGEIELNSINFRYEEEQPLVLKDVSIRIKAGEMVAFVGPSGSGKSTIMRILLGFEEPESGSVYYDGQAFDSLNKDLVRQQVGVVLQNGALMQGSIFKNIVGNSELGLEQAWEAARMAGMEEDIKQMPMEMHTVISEGAGTFSGGQRQRLMIARAIVHKPRMLFMDEATSALDNRTQNIVSESLDRLQATRIVIAHRLSTVINADRIFVMEDGVIVESGTYAELIDQEGLFSKLAKRQIA